MNDTGCDKQTTDAQRSIGGKVAVPNLVGRLYNRRRALYQEIERIDNTISLLEKNAALVEIVEVVLLGQAKAEGLPY